MLDLVIYLFPCLPRRGASQCLQLLPQLPPKAAQLAQRQVLQRGGGGGTVGGSAAGTGDQRACKPWQVHVPAGRPRAAAARLRLLRPPGTCMTSGTERGGMTVCWLGLFMAEPILDSSLLVLMPAEEVKPEGQRSGLEWRG